MKLLARFEARATTTTATPAVPTPDRNAAVSSAARNLALAHYIQRMIERGLIADYTQAARMLGVSQPRLTHVMSLLLLSPAIQEEILFGRMAPGDKELRRMARVAEWQEQLVSHRRLILASPIPSAQAKPNSRSMIPHQMLS